MFLKRRMGISNRDKGFCYLCSLSNVLFKYSRLSQAMIPRYAAGISRVLVRINTSQLKRAELCPTLFSWWAIKDSRPSARRRAKAFGSAKHGKLRSPLGFFACRFESKQPPIQNPALLPGLLLVSFYAHARTHFSTKCEK
jgi:hypothetical protein